MAFGIDAALYIARKSAENALAENALAEVREFPPPCPECDHLRTMVAELQTKEREQWVEIERLKRKGKQP